MANYESNKLHQKLRENKFSIIVNETTDIDTTKSCGIVVRFYDPETKQIQSRLLQLANIFADKSTTGATGERLHKIITQCLETHNIPKENVIGFASDGASNITGKYNSLTSRLNNEMPGITILKCVCHSVHLCSSQASKFLPRRCEDLIRNIYSHFSHSAKRMHLFKEFQEFCDVKPHKMLHVCQTRWLSYHAAVERLLEQWEPLKLYFINCSAEDRLHSTISILDTMNDPSMKLYYTFLNFILPKFNHLNLLFQQQEPTIQVLHKKCHDLYTDLLRCLFKRDEINMANDIASLDLDNEALYLPVNQMYLGSDMHSLLQSEEYRHRKELTGNVFRRCRQFIIIACKEIKKRFPLGNNEFEMLRIFVPKFFLDERSRISMPTLRDLVNAFPRITVNPQHLDDEWRAVENAEIPEEIKIISNPEKFFTALSTLRDDFNQPMFEIFSKYALEVLSLPTSNVDVERLFSKVNLLK
ncbi:zinc finger BED domain-containing protein 5-like [Oratosquilla oratoria]|uniref:zinc finger BED domain-containing protein 5-like n=1 Tax=Oratosquilla oratoria TaxID=337810 RepID=UPI003F76C740